jgi:hypothetical protein
LNYWLLVTLWLTLILELTLFVFSWFYSYTTTFRHRKRRQTRQWWSILRIRWRALLSCWFSRWEPIHCENSHGIGKIVLQTNELQNKTTLSFLSHRTCNDLFNSILIWSIGVKHVAWLVRLFVFVFQIEYRYPIEEVLQRYKTCAKTVHFNSMCS